MYSVLTKTINMNGQDIVTCVDYGTEKCRIHMNTPDCAHCEMLCAIFNKLRSYEECIDESEDEV